MGSIGLGPTAHGGGDTPRRVIDILFDVRFPEPKYQPAVVTQRGGDLLVSLDSPGELVTPIGSRRFCETPNFRLERIWTAIDQQSSVPVVSINKDRNSRPRKHNIWPPEQVVPVFSVSQAEPMQGLPQGRLCQVPR